MSPPGWYPDPASGGDPSSRALRYYDGVRWTQQVALPAAPGPLPPAPRVAHPSLPLPVAMWALVSVIVPLIAGRYLIQWLAEFHWPIAVYVVVMGVVGYGPPLLFWRYASSRWGTGDARADVGLSARWVDAGWGPVTWLACLGAQIVVAVVVTQLDVPFESNTEGISDLRGERGYVIALLVLAVIAAPFVEEIVFRGLVMRGLLSSMPAWLAIVVQAVLFGAAHFDPSRGMGNIGLVLILSAAGGMLGGAAYLLRRLAPSMVAHMIINAIAMTVALVRD